MTEALTAMLSTGAVPTLAFLTPAEQSALTLSAVTALCVALVCVPPGVLVAWWLARKEFVGKTLLDTVVHLPLVLPPVVVGYALLAAFGREGWIGSLLAGVGLEVAFTPVAVVIAGAAMAFPLLVRSARLAFESVDPALEDAARTLGRGPFLTWWRVSLPLALPGIAAGTLLCFARALGEFGATITFAGNIAGETRTLPLLIFTELQSPGGELRLGRLVALSIAISLVALVLSERGARRVRRNFGNARAGNGGAGGGR